MLHDRTRIDSRPERLRVALKWQGFGMIVGVGFFLIGCAGAKLAPIPPCPNPEDNACVSASAGRMGTGDAVCALDSSRTSLHLQIVMDCPAQDLVLTIRNGDPYDSKFQPLREPRSEILTPNKVELLQTKTPFALTPDIVRLVVQVQANCREGDQVVMRHGDTSCQVPPPKGHE